MPKIIYIASDGARSEAEVPVGENLMRGALNNYIEGITGECGGAPSCATCHVYIDEQWTALTGGPGEIECELLEAAASPVRPNSRLSCQILATEALDGLVVHMPEHQF